MLLIAAGGAYLLVMRRLSPYRAAPRRPWWVESWANGLLPATYTQEGRLVLRTMHAWIIAIFVVEVVGIILLVIA
ncbi:MAG TPA: hypothetical protein VEU55_04960 [Gemmatimonadales bacterium]|nr:hypothetical protein [Gemmatimonadales bacterium]